MQISNFKGLKSQTFETLRLFSDDIVMSLEFSDDISYVVRNKKHLKTTRKSPCVQKLRNIIHSTYPSVKVDTSEN